jgi:hypothetical protein
MRQKDIAALIFVAAIAAVISFLVAGAVFSPKKYSTQVPVAQDIDGTFPDVKNDPAYSSYLNPNGLDLTVPVQIGDSQNTAPFSGQ